MCISLLGNLWHILILWQDVVGIYAMASVLPEEWDWWIGLFSHSSLCPRVKCHCLALILYQLGCLFVSTYPRLLGSILNKSLQHLFQSFLFSPNHDILLLACAVTWSCLCSSLSSGLLILNLFLLQVSSGARFSRNANWPWANDRWIHSCDVQWERGGCSWKCLGCGPQETFPQTQCIWKCLLKQVRIKISIPTL